MANWVDKYKQLISSSHKPHVIVADKDQLFAYAELQQAIEEAGYRILKAETELAVRFLFELEVRDSKDACLVVAPSTYTPLPDILSAVQYQAIGLKDLFPYLDAKSIQGLSFNGLCLLSNIKHYEELGRDKTLKFLLENLYNVDFDTLTSSKSRERILNALITVFLERNGINQPLATFLSNLAKPYLPELVEKGMSKANLIAYLQDKWLEYLNVGTSEIDFQDPVLNRSFGYLFVFDHLIPAKISREKFSSLPKSLTIGAFVDEKESNDRELEALIQYSEQQLTSIEDEYSQWFSVIQVLAKAKLRYLNSENGSLKKQFDGVTKLLNARFQRFIDNSYASLFSLSGVRRPVLVTRVLEFMRAQPEQRKALIVIDCLNYWQWLLIARALREDGIEVAANTTLAFIPSITAWSRQALFRGTKPDLTENNSKEAGLFTEYWKAAGYGPYQIQFMRFGIDDQSQIASISDDVKILGAVCTDLDEVMHGSKLGDQQLLTSTQQWIGKSKFVESIAALRSKGFRTFVTTDHGNVEATGVKNLKVSEKVGAISRSIRHIHFSNETMLSSFRDQNPGLAVGIKSTSVYLKHEEAFTDENKKVITHGGSHLWEVLVPFIDIQ